MKKTVKGKEVSVGIDSSAFSIKGDGIDVILPAEYIRPILGLVSVMIDEELPALLDKLYIDRDEQWEVKMTCTLNPDKLFSGNWSPEED